MKFFSALIAALLIAISALARDYDFAHRTNQTTVTLALRWSLLINPYPAIALAARN